MLNQLLLVLVQLQPRCKVWVAFDQLCGGKSDGDAGCLGMCVLTVLAQIVVTLLLTRFLEEYVNIAYAALELLGIVMAV